MSSEGRIVSRQCRECGDAFDAYKSQKTTVCAACEIAGFNDPFLVRVRRIPGAWRPWNFKRRKHK